MAHLDGTAELTPKGTPANWPRILYVTPFWHGEAASAAEWRAVQIARALQQIAALEVVVLGDVESCPNESWAQKVNWLVNPRTATPHGIGVNQTTLQRLIQTAPQFDVIWFYELRTANMFPRWHWPRSVVDINDVPSLFEASLLKRERLRRKRVTSRLRRWSWQRRERLLQERFSVFTVCSREDQRYLQQLGMTAPLHVVPNGYDPPAPGTVRRAATPPRIGFIGVFDHEPNVEGIHWFVRSCWPRIKREIPEARLRLVGRFSDGPLRPQGLDIDALGRVDDPTQEMSTWSAMVVPVHTGAGTRGKIAHAFSLKCPVVSTSLGAYGYDARNARDMFLADAADQFAEACIRTIQQPAEAAAVADRAWQQFLEKWTWDAIKPRVWAAADDCLRATERLEANDRR